MEQNLTRTDDYATRGMRYTRDQFGQVLQQTEEYVRDKPVQSVGYALLAGFILNKLPIFRIFGGLLRLLVMAAKPAILIYGATKLYKAAQEEPR
jgi:hypothetical protein